MILFSVDLETTGLDPKTCQIIEIGVVVEDTLNQKPLELLPKFHCYVEHEIYQGEPYALAMHQAIFKRIADKEEGYKYLTPYWAAAGLNLFMRSHLPDTEKYTITGKNAASFDVPFLKANPYLEPTAKKFHHRILDVGSLFFNPQLDITLPSTVECLKRAGLSTDVKHNSIDDCLQIISLVRKYYEMKKNSVVLTVGGAGPYSLNVGAAANMGIGGCGLNNNVGIANGQIFPVGGFFKQ